MPRGPIPTFQDSGFGASSFRPGDSIADLIMRSGQARAEGALRSGQGWSNAIGDIGQNLSGALAGIFQKRRNDQAQDAFSAATSPEYPSATKPIPGSDADVPDPGIDHMEAILGRLPPEDRPKVQKAVIDFQDAATKSREARLRTAKLEQELVESRKTSRQHDIDTIATGAFHARDWLDRADGGLSAIGLLSHQAKAAGIEGAEQYDDFLAGANDAWQAAQGDPKAMATVADSIRQQAAPILDRFMSGASPAVMEKFKPQTETITTTNPDGSTTQRIVEKKPGQTFTSSPKPAIIGSFEDFVVKKYGRSATPEQIAEARKVYGQADDRNPNAGGMGDLYGGIDPKAIAAAIQRGEQPPNITDLGRPVGAAVSSELAKSGYNLAKAQTDWKATQKHIATLNGAQQLRLNQAVNSLPDLLDSVDDLATQWKGGKFPVLNKANLALAKGGAYGSDVASVANKLDAQVADVVADLAVVYMGGNSPTDHGLQLAGKSLSGDWDEKVLRDMVKMAKGNVTIRRNSILNTGVAGASEGNQYAPPPPAAAAPPPPAGGGMPEPTATGPNGQKLVLRNGPWVPVQ